MLKLCRPFDTSRRVVAYLAYFAHFSLLSRTWQSPPPCRRSNHCCSFHQRPPARNTDPFQKFHLHRLLAMLHRKPSSGQQRCLFQRFNVGWAFAFLARRPLLDGLRKLCSICVIHTSPAVGISRSLPASLAHQYPLSLISASSHKSIATHHRFSLRVRSRHQHGPTARCS